MKFVVGFSGEGDSALEKRMVREMVGRIDERNCGDPSEFYSQDLRESWYREGENHRVVNGLVRRDMPDEVWLVDFGSIEDLMEYVNQKGLCVISPADRPFYWSVPSIEPLTDHYDD